jgi:hypothetical protein
MDGPAGYNGWDLADPNEKPGPCRKCKGTGEFRFGWNGQKMTKSGPCHSCSGTGRQSRADIARNNRYNDHKLAAIFLSDIRRIESEAESEAAHG